MAIRIGSATSFSESTRQWLKHTPAGGRECRVSAEPGDGGLARFTVEDSGEGHAPAMLCRASLNAFTGVPRGNSGFPAGAGLVARDRQGHRRERARRNDHRQRAGPAGESLQLSR